MPQHLKASRNAEIFAKCIEGIAYSAIAAEHAVSEARVEQIFKGEVKRQHPDLVIAGGQGYRTRVIDALKAMEPAT